MRKIGVIALVLGIAAVSAQAVIYTTAAQGALQVVLTINPDGTAMLSGPAGWVNFDGYEIHSAAGKLIVGQVYQAAQHHPPYPVEKPMVPYVAGWASGTLANNVLTANSVLYGSGAFGTNTTPSTTLLAEMNQSGNAFLSDVAGGAVWRFADSNVPTGEKVFQVNTPKTDITAYYSMPGHSGDKFLMTVVPEPATMSLLLIGGIAAFARRRR